MVYGPLHARLLRLSHAVRLQLPGNVIFESDATGLQVVRDGREYPWKKYIHDFGAPARGAPVTAFYCGMGASPFKGVFLRLEIPSAGKAGPGL
jgi:hypothetical protein